MHQYTKGYDKDSGGCVSGEVAVAIFLRLLSGGMIYDIASCWGLYPNSLYRIFDRVWSWINGIPFGMVDIKRYLSAEDCPESRIRKSVMAGFAKLSSGVLTGCIGVLDGWTIQDLEMQASPAWNQQTCLTTTKHV